MENRFNFETITIENEKLKLVLDRELGLTAVSFMDGNEELLYFDPEAREKRMAYGIPVLYPTPKKMPGNMFTFEGREYHGKTNGFFKDTRLEITDRTGSSIAGRIEVTEDSIAYETFPFIHEVEMEIRLEENGIEYIFTIENRDEKNMPFGIALHPFFHRDENTTVVSDAEVEMLKGECNSPTGVLIPSRFMIPGSTQNQQKANILYSREHAVTSCLETSTHRIRVNGDEHFHHVVMYSLIGEPFYSIEPQSVTNNAINLYSTDLRDMTGLQILKPGEIHTNKVWITLE